MKDGISLHGRDYFDDLQKFRDMALEESHWEGRRKRIGKFTYGIVHAQWESETGGRAHLLEEGIRSSDRRCLNRAYPTTLELYDHGDNGEGTLMTRFSIDDSIGLVKVFRALIVKPSIWKMPGLEIAQKIESRHKLDDPTDSDRILLYEEMKRGASGMYPCGDMDDDYQDEEDDSNDY